MLRTSAGHTARNYLAALGYVFLEFFNFFVIDMRNFFDTEMTNLWPTLAAFAVECILHLRLHLFLERYLHVSRPLRAADLGKIEGEFIFESLFFAQAAHISAQYRIRHLLFWMVLLHCGV